MIARDRTTMDICYNNYLSRWLVKGVKRSDLKKQIGPGQGALAKLAKIKTVSMDIIVKICRTRAYMVDEILNIILSPDSGTADKMHS